jgi:hypothetical protein
MSTDTTTPEFSALFPLKIADDFVSELKVMQSGAGFYIGRSYWDSEFEFEGPYSRESGYYAFEGDATRDLKHDMFSRRSCVENDWSYDNGELPDIREVKVNPAIRGEH